MRCFEEVSRRLTNGGVVLIEAFVSDLARFVRGQTTQTVRVDTDEVTIDVLRHDPVGQIVTTQHILLTEQDTCMYIRSGSDTPGCHSSI